MSLQEKLEQGSVEFQKLQTELSKAVEARQRLEAQESENELVKKVFLGDAASTFLWLIRGAGIRNIDGR